VGRSLRELALPRRRGISVVAVRDVLLGRVQAVPNPDSVLKESDTLLVAGSDENLAKAARIR
jgi:trk system potassium uptake protein TrkA